MRPAGRGVPGGCPGSAPELGTDAASWPPSGFPHLLVADDLVAEGHLRGAYLAVCGVLVLASSLPSSSCPEDCECDCYLYCPQCVRRALQNVAAHPSSGNAEPDPGLRNYFVGECGHRRVINEWGHLGPCPCDPDTRAELSSAGWHTSRRSPTTDPAAHRRDRDQSQRRRGRGPGGTPLRTPRIRPVRAQPTPPGSPARNARSSLPRSSAQYPPGPARPAPRTQLTAWRGPAPTALYSGLESASSAASRSGRSTVTVRHSTSRSK